MLIPYNLLLENILEKKVFCSEEEKIQIFPTSKKLEDNYLKIRNEIPEYRKENVGRKFINEEEEFFKDWNTFPLRMFDKDYEENMNKCPVLKEILKNDTNITSAFFSIMEPGKLLSSHYGPFKGILRYHLGLEIPKGLCYISVDGETYDWKEGEGVLFDETYKHFVQNSTDFRRVILFLDVKRPLSFPLNFANNFILFLMSISPYNFI